MRLLSTGQYAQLVGLSVSALRFYADSGLLLPAQVDQESGYRYYSAEQVALGQKIAALRKLEVPLAELFRLLSADAGESACILEQHERRLYERFQVQRQLLHQVAGLLSGQRTLPAVEVTYRSWPAQTVLSLTGSACAEAFNDLYVGALAELKCRAAQSGGAVMGADFGLYHADEYLGGPLQVEVCLPIAGTAAAEPPMRLIHLPACRVACALHPGGWQTFGLTFSAIYADAVRSGHGTGASYTLGRPDGTELGFLLR